APDSSRIVIIRFALSIAWIVAVAVTVADLVTGFCGAAAPEPSMRDRTSAGIACIEPPRRALQPGCREDRLRRTGGAGDFPRIVVGFDGGSRPLSRETPPRGVGSDVVSARASGGSRQDMAGAPALADRGRAPRRDRQRAAHGRDHAAPA